MPLTDQKWCQDDRWVITDQPFETLSSPKCDLAYKSLHFYFISYFPAVAILYKVKIHYYVAPVLRAVCEESSTQTKGMEVKCKGGLGRTPIWLWKGAELKQVSEGWLTSQDIPA